MTQTIKTSDHKALNEAFAEKVAGWTRDADGLWMEGEYRIDVEGNLLVPRFTRSADAVLPFMVDQKWSACTCNRVIRMGFKGDGWCVWQGGPEDSGQPLAYGETFPHAAVIALLRAHGVEVIDDE